MDLDRLLAALGRRWQMLLIGFLVASLAAVFSGYELDGGTLVSRATPKFESTSRIVVIAPDQSFFAIGSQPILDPDTGGPLETARGYRPQELAEIYAFFVIGDEVRSRIESEVGGLRSGESLSAARRRGGPTEAESEAPSNSVLPILEITATAASAARADQLAEATTDTFVAFVTEQQVVRGVMPALRVQLQVLSAASGASNKSGSAKGTLAIVFLGVFSAFVSLAFARGNRLRNAAVAGDDDVRWVNLVVPVGDTTGSLPTMIRELRPTEGPTPASDTEHDARPARREDAAPSTDAGRSQVAQRAEPTGAASDPQGDSVPGHVRYRHQEALQTQRWRQDDD